MKCIICGIELRGRQEKYCSKKCADRQNYLNHRECYIENAKKWKRENPLTKEQMKIKNAKYYEENKARFREQAKAYYLKNKDKILAQQKAYRKQKKVLLSSGVHKKVGVKHDY